MLVDIVTPLSRTFCLCNTQENMVTDGCLSMRHFPHHVRWKSYIWKLGKGFWNIKLTFISFISYLCKNHLWFMWPCHLKDLAFQLSWAGRWQINLLCTVWGYVGCKWPYTFDGILQYVTKETKKCWLNSDTQLLNKPVKLVFSKLTIQMQFIHYRWLWWKACEPDEVLPRDLIVLHIQWNPVLMLSAAPCQVWIINIGLTIKVYIISF